MTKLEELKAAFAAADCEDARARAYRNIWDAYRAELEADYRDARVARDAAWEASHDKLILD